MATGLARKVPAMTPQTPVSAVGSGGTALVGVAVG
jgi:hypothetical protein